MNGVMMFCEILAAWTITGAVESSPGWMTIDYIDHNQTADFMVVPMEMYEECAVPTTGVSRS